MRAIVVIKTLGCFRNFLKFYLLAEGGRPMAGLSQLAPAEGLFALLTRLFSKLTKERGGTQKSKFQNRDRQTITHTDILAI